MKKPIVATLALSLALSPFAAMAVSGVNADDIYMTIKTKQGGEWFTAYQGKTDDDSSMRLKKVLPGKYIFEVDEDDEEAGQKLGLELRMLDEDGKQIREKTDVDAYIYIGENKVFINTFETTENGYIKLEGITPGMTYELDVKGEGKVKKAEGQARMKTKAKIDNSDWFSSNYELLEADASGLTNGTFTMDSVLPGKYKFKLKSGDPYNPAKPFTVKARMRKENGKKIKKPTKVTVYAYPFKVKTKVAELKTDTKGWVTIPGAQPGMKYKLKVKD